MPTATSTYHAPGPNSGYIPQYGNPGLTAKLQVMFSRNPQSFALGNYLQMIPTAQQLGFYPELDTLDQSRVVNLQDAAWNDGADRPSPNVRDMRWKPFRTNRYNYGVRLGNLTIEQSAVDQLAANSMQEAQRAMTARTYKAITVATTSANWPSANYSADIDTLLSGSGLSWFSSSATDLTIQKSFHRIQEAVLKATAGVVNPADIMLVIGPDVAHKIAETAEFQAWAKNNVAAMSAAEESGIFRAYGLPPILFGMRIQVEDCVRTSTRKGATATTAFAMGNAAFVCSRPGGLVGPNAAAGTDGTVRASTNFSTISMFVKEEMTAENKVDGWNRVTEIGIADDFDVVLSAPISGYLIGDVST